LSWQLPLIVHIITKYKITHYQHLIVHNREFRTFGNRKNYFKSTTVTLQGNDVRLYLCLHCIIINNNNWFFGLKFFFHFFSCTVASVEISDRKDLNTLYKFRNLISVNRIFIKDYKVSVSIWHIRSESRVTFEMPQLSDLQKCVWLRDGVSIRAIAREINVDNVWVTFWETSLSIPFTKLKVWRCQSVWVFNGRNCTFKHPR
jgi:hypothetical protein